MSEPDIAFLREEAPEEVLPEQTQEPVPETLEANQTVETPVTPATEVATTPEPDKEVNGLKAAAIAERRKRQELERQLQELQRQPQQTPDFFKEPQEYVHQAISQTRQELVQAHYAALEDLARETYPDYDEVFEEVQAQAAENPALVQQIFASANPAKAVYKLGKQLRELKQMQDPDAYRQKIEAEVRAKVEAEFAAKEEAKRKAAEAVPPDLTAARSSKDSEVLPDDSLDSILKSKR
jgi:hypothetical protein